MTQARASVTDGSDLGVRGGVMASRYGIGPNPNYFIIFHYDGSHRTIAALEGGFTVLQDQPHERRVSCLLVSYLLKCSHGIEGA